MRGRTDKRDQLAQEQSTTMPTGGVRHGFPLAEKESHGDKLSEHLLYESVSLEHILHPENLQQAWEQVRRNKGVAGIDGVSISGFPEFYRQYGESIRQKLEDGTYMPSPVKRVEIPKPDGGRRPLGIPTVLDRVIQQAIATWQAGAGKDIGVLVIPRSSELPYTMNGSRSKAFQALSISGNPFDTQINQKRS